MSIGFIEVQGLGDNVPCIGKVTAAYTVAMIAVGREDLECLAAGVAPTKSCRAQAEAVISYLDAQEATDG